MRNEKMKAVIATKYGGPEVLQVQMVDKPVPKANEVLVRVYAAPVTRAETMIRTGYPLIGRLLIGLTKPKKIIPGTGFAGEIEAIGKGVTQLKIGDKVFGESLWEHGTCAEYICVEETGIISKKPENISYEEAAVASDGLITSMNFLKELITLEPGQRILINGASGSLGTAAIQLAKNIGAEVTAVCSTKNIALVKSLGADHVVDYKNEDFTHNGQSYDVIYDTVGKRSFSKCKNSLTKNGKYISPVLGFTLLVQMMWTSMVGGKRALFSATGTLSVPKLRSILSEIKELFEAGKIKTIIDKRYSLEQTAKAHQYVDTGHKRGNVVLLT